MKLSRFMLAFSVAISAVPTNSGSLVTSPKTPEQLSPNIGNDTPTFQDKLTQDAQSFHEAFVQRVAAGDRSSGLYECFSRKVSNGSLVSYDPADVASLRQVNYTPTNWNLPPIIVIDPGHGHKTTNSGKGLVDIGASRNDVREVDVIDNVTTALIHELKARDLAFVTTRKSLDDEVTLTRKSFFPEHPAALQVRAELSNEIAKRYPNYPVIFIRLHADTSQDPTKSGTVVFSYAEEFGRRALSPLSVKLAHSLSAHFKLYPGAPTQHKTEDFAVLRCQPENVSAVLVELGFLSNTHDRRILSDSAHAQRLARGLANGIENFVAQQRGGEIRVALNAAP